jgi:hypothetical protein
VDLDFGHIGKPKDRVADPVTGGYLAPVECHHLLQRPTRGLDDSTLYLHFDPFRINDLTGIRRGDDPADDNLSRLRTYPDLSDAMAEPSIDILALLMRKKTAACPTHSRLVFTPSTSALFHFCR